MISYCNARSCLAGIWNQQHRTRVEDSKVSLTEYRTAAALGGLQSFRPKTYSQLKTGMEGLGSDSGFMSLDTSFGFFGAEALGRRSRT